MTSTVSHTHLLLIPSSNTGAKVYETVRAARTVSYTLGPVS